MPRIFFPASRHSSITMSMCFGLVVFSMLNVQRGPCFPPNLETHVDPAQTKVCKSSSGSHVPPLCTQETIRHVPSSSVVVAFGGLVAPSTRPASIGTREMARIVLDPRSQETGGGE